MADAQLKERCPWVPIWQESRLRVRSAEVRIFAAGIMAYVASLIVRLQERGLFDGETEINWPEKRDETLALLNRIIAHPRPQPTRDVGR